MDFFTTGDLDYFTSLVGTKFEKDEPSAKIIRHKLREQGVFAKTAHWAKLCSDQGYSIETSFYWQMSGKIRRYSWARVFLRGFEDTKVFFTVGVGTDKDEYGKITATIDYKLDCRRDKLAKHQVDLFDKFLIDQLGKYPWITISGAEVENYDWDKLLLDTLAFMEGHKDWYKASVNLIWPNGVGIEPKIARLCWNTDNWKRPTGPSGKSTSVANAFEKEKGYGYEEWLFDTDKQIGGYHYGFIQAFNKGEHPGKTYDVELYSLKNNLQNRTMGYYWIAHIPNLEVLNTEQIQRAIDIYKDKGWYAEMLAQLKEIGVDGFNFDPIPEEYIFNVRFKVKEDSFKLFDPPMRILDPVTEIGKNKHYVLLNKSNHTSIKPEKVGKYEFREGHNPTKKGAVNVIPSRREYTKNLLHEEIKETVYQLFKTKFKETDIKVGTEVPSGFGKEIDLVVKDGLNGDTFYEIKTSINPLGCIREALGQILEYCFYHENRNANKLVIIAPGPPSEMQKSYLTHLRKVLGIELYYQQFNRKTQVLEKEW